MEIQIFKHEKFGDIRTINKDGEPWFVGKDVAEVLGYADTRKAIRMHVDDDDKGGDILSTPGGRQQITIINESGLYALILSSKLPQAKEFKRWVTNEVLPQIRKTGGYIPLNDCEDSADIMARALLELLPLQGEYTNALYIGRCPMLCANLALSGRMLA